jgi:hypothetical protein
MANVAGAISSAWWKTCARSIAEQLELPPGYYVEFGGQFESAEAAAERLALLGRGGGRRHLPVAGDRVRLGPETRGW